jgi:hypothetical protein
MGCSVVRPTSLWCGHDGVCGKRVRGVVVFVFRTPGPGLTERLSTCCNLQHRIIGDRERLYLTIVDVEPVMHTASD